jgi:hypothetical protein
MKKQTHLSIPPLLLPCPTPFFAQTVASVIIIAVHPNDRQQRMRPALSPPQQPAADAAVAAILHDPVNI